MRSGMPCSSAINLHWSRSTKVQKGCDEQHLRSGIGTLVELQTLRTTTANGLGTVFCPIDRLQADRGTQGEP